MNFNKKTVIKTMLICCLMVALSPLNNAWGRESLTIHKQDGSRVSFNVELARTQAEQERGLMFRSFMRPESGMLFLFNEPRVVSFWMKNTYIPLDIIFIGIDGRITKIVRNAKPGSLKTISSQTSVIAVLEINAMLSDQFGINENDAVLY